MTQRTDRASEFLARTEDIEPMPVVTKDDERSLVMDATAAPSIIDTVFPCSQFQPPLQYEKPPDTTTLLLKVAWERRGLIMAAVGIAGLAITKKIRNS